MTKQLGVVGVLVPFVAVLFAFGSAEGQKEPVKVRREYQVFNMLDFSMQNSARLMQPGTAPGGGDAKAVFDHATKPLVEEFNKLGEEGWELCSGDGAMYWFKRRK